MADDVDAAGVQMIDLPKLSETEPTSKNPRDVGSHAAQEDPQQCDASAQVCVDVDGHDIDMVCAPTQTAATAKRRLPDYWMALAGIVVALLVIASLGAWFGHRAHQAQEAEQQRNLFLQIGCQGALNLTTIDYTKVDADIQQVLNSSTGTFHEDFQTRSPALAEFVKKAKSKTHGTITASGIESISGDSARVLVEVSVNVSNIGAAEQEPRNWRMRIDVQKEGGTVKVSNVGFVV